MLASPAAALKQNVKPLLSAQQQAYDALRARLPKKTSKGRRAWLADQMGIEDRYAIIADMDDVECATVVEICKAPR